MPTVEAEEESESQDQEPEPEKSQNYHKNPANFRVNFHNLLDKLKQSWAESIGIQRMQKIMIDGDLQSRN
jgi:hypothetical protein